MCWVAKGFLIVCRKNGMQFNMGKWGGERQKIKVQILLVKKVWITP